MDRPLARGQPLWWILGYINTMTSYRQWFEMVLALVFAIAVTVVLTPIVPDLASTAGAVLAATYFFSRYPWGGREETNAQLDAFFDDNLPF